MTGQRQKPGAAQIRPMTDKDLDAIVQIDAMYSGTARTEYYQEKLGTATSGAGINTSLVAELDGRVVGFVMGRLYIGEFGIPETTANLDTIGVHPNEAGTGTALQLIEYFTDQVRKLGVNTVHTLVDWNDRKLMLFFNRSGFVPSSRLSLEMDLKK
jgi:predicted N-acetyltransferase YhbS